MMAPGRPGLQARRKDGSVFFAEIGLSPLPTEDGVIVVATVRDVSERMAAEEERRTLEAELRQAQKMEAIGTLAGGIAHDFNNILAAVMGNAELLAMEIDADDPAQEPIAEIRRASARARDLVRQILAFSRKQERPKASLELRPAVEEVVQLLRAGLPAGVDLRTEFAADVPGVLADATQIHQVLLNLCTNAWQALEGEPGRIEIRVEGVYLDEQAVRAHGGLSPGLHARLIVRDTGNGMDARVLERVFEPFFTTKGVGGGTGLGLAVVHGIVNAHGGAITVASTPGEGTTFDVYLPAERKADVAPGAGPTAVPRGGGERILYVDDEPSLVIWARRMLEQIGYRVLGVTSFDDAMAALRDPAERFDAMLTDMNMPSGSGLDLIRVARELRPQMPVALISGFATADLHAAAAVLGCSEVLSKPASGAEVAGALRRMLDGDAAPGKS
jgi:signal transduction histidine kinase/ActR/RegA family two-component response regulator